MCLPIFKNIIKDEDHLNILKIYCTFKGELRALQPNFIIRGQSMSGKPNSPTRFYL